jgi:Lar family restriction alleviation protein
VSDIKPCPFCGHIGIHIQDGDTFRWRYAECGSCGARAPEVRINTIEEDRAKANADVTAKAIQEWNNRT